MEEKIKVKKGKIVRRQWKGDGRDKVGRGERKKDDQINGVAKLG